MDLAVDDERVDPHAAVVHRNEAAAVHVAGTGVDVDHGDVRAVGVRQVRRVVHGLRVEASLEALRHR